MVAEGGQLLHGLMLPLAKLKREDEGKKTRSQFTYTMQPFWIQQGRECN